MNLDTYMQTILQNSYEDAFTNPNGLSSLVKLHFI